MKVLLDGPGHGVIGAVSVQESAEIFKAEPADVMAGFDGGLAERFSQ